MVIKIETRRNASEQWFLYCYAGTLVQAMTDCNRCKARGYKVRLSNAETGFIIQES
jgi:hypothetical protein